MIPPLTKKELVSGGTPCPLIETDISPVTAFCGSKTFTCPSSLIAVPPYWEMMLSGVLKTEDIHVPQ